MDAAARYRNSEKGREAKRRYQNSDKCRAAGASYYELNKEKINKRSKDRYLRQKTHVPPVSATLESLMGIVVSSTSVVPSADTQDSSSVLI